MIHIRATQIRVLKPQTHQPATYASVGKMNLNQQIVRPIFANPVLVIMVVLAFYTTHAKLGAIRPKLEKRVGN